MAMTVQQAQQLVDSQTAPPDVPAPSGGLGGSTGSDYFNGLDVGKLQFLASFGVDLANPPDDATIAYILYNGGRGGPTELQILKDAGLITPSQINEQLFPGPGAGGPNSQLKKIGNSYYNYDPATGQLTPAAVDSNGNPIAGSGGGGGGGTDHYATDVAARNAANQLAYNYATLAEQQRQFGITNPEEELARQQGYLQNRATTGLNLGQFAQSLAQDQYKVALDPGNYPAYLAASAGLPQGSGSPISALIGQGTQIAPPGGANPLADPRFQNLLGNLYEYAQPGALGTVQGIAAQHGGTLPPEFYKYTGTQDPNAVPAHATGGNQVFTSPVIGVDALTGQPKFVAGEAGPEQISFHPMHTHASNGVPMPHQHQYGEHGHEHMGNVIQFADGGAVIAGTGPTRHQLVSAWNAYHPNNLMPDTTFTPAEGTAISAGKALQPLGYAPQYLTQQLLEGRTPTPGSLDEATLSRLPPSIRALLQAQIRSALGGAGVMDYNAALQQQALPGLNSGNVSTSYQ